MAKPSLYIHSASGSVFKATDTRTGNTVAIKQMVIAKQVKKDIIVNEIAIMKESNHASIVNYVDSYIVNGVLWVIMELIDGGSLSELLVVHKTMSEPTIALIMKVEISQTTTLFHILMHYMALTLFFFNSLYWKDCIICTP